MPVCITGMHRSGTSLVANLLHRSGVYVGEKHELMQPTRDNEQGYWENWEFVNLNDSILAELGGSWHSPPAPNNAWYDEERWNDLRVRAEVLLRRFTPHEPWGWKDPRTSLTIPFWFNLNSILMPFWLGRGSKLKVVLCLRDPLEVFQSLRDRTTAPNSSGLDLWLTYNRSVLNHTLPADRIVTHYEAYFRDPQAELCRVLEFLEIPATKATIESSVHVVSSSMRHKKSSINNLINNNVTEEVVELYVEMCNEANYSEPFKSSKS